MISINMFTNAGFYIIYEKTTDSLLLLSPTHDPIK